MKNKSTLETMAHKGDPPRRMTRCIATVPEEQIICGNIFPKKDAHYIGGPYCPKCYERWFYQQD